MVKFRLSSLVPVSGGCIMYARTRWRGGNEIVLIMQNWVKSKGNSNDFFFFFFFNLTFLLFLVSKLGRLR
jgi:hypothetical protein